MKDSIILKDPLYKHIMIPSSYKKYLDSEWFQRLRYIKQTSFSEFVYPNANHTRFSHSLGAFHLMNKAVLKLNTDSETKKNLKLAALFHDIAHGPFSHLWERVFPHFNHEEVGQEVLRSLGLSKVADILISKNEFSPLISSALDVDKLDYMARDSYFSGVSYGVLEVDFILEHLYVRKGKLLIKPSAISSVEDLITQRVNLYKTVYLHKIAIERDFVFEKIFLRIRDLLNLGIDVPINPHLKTFFNKTNTKENLFNLNDYIVLSEVFKLKDFEDKILSDLCNRFIYRKKFKVVNQNHYKLNSEEILQKVKKKYDPRYYFGNVCYPIKILQSRIYVEFSPDRIKSLEEVSDLIKFYSKQKFNAEFIIFPENVEL